MNIVISNISPDDADQVARTLVEERAAACVNLLPVRSVYRWDGGIQVDSEVTLLIKVSADGVGSLVSRLRELHPYALPEIVVLDVNAGQSLADYVHWVRAETGD